MPKPLILFFADHHAGGGYPHRGINDGPHSLNQIMEYAEANARTLSWVISLGDAVQDQRSHADGPVPLKNMLRRVVEAEIKFGFIDGNHDKHVISWLDDPHFYHLDKEIIEVGGQQWYGLDFRPREQIQIALAEVPAEVNALMMHQAWQDFINFEETPQCCFADIPGHVTVLATGDYHGESVLKQFRGKEGQQVMVCNPGTTSMQNIMEPPDKYFVTFNDDGSFKKHKLKTRPVLRSSILANNDEFNEFLEQVRTVIEGAVATADKLDLPEEQAKPLLQVVFSSEIPDVTRRVTKVVDGAAHLFWREMKPERVTRTFEVNKEAAKGRAFLPMDLLSEEINPDNPEDKLARPAYELAEVLYHEADKATIRKRVETWLAEAVAEE